MNMKGPSLRCPCLHVEGYSSLLCRNVCVLFHLGLKCDGAKDLKYPEVLHMSESSTEYGINRTAVLLWQPGAKFDLLCVPTSNQQNLG